MRTEPELVTSAATATRPARSASRFTPRCPSVSSVDKYRHCPCAVSISSQVQEHGPAPFAAACLNSGAAISFRFRRPEQVLGRDTGPLTCPTSIRRASHGLAQACRYPVGAPSGAEPRREEHPRVRADSGRGTSMATGTCSARAALTYITHRPALWPVEVGASHRPPFPPSTAGKARIWHLPFRCAATHQASAAGNRRPRFHALAPAGRGPRAPKPPSAVRRSWSRNRIAYTSYGLSNSVAEGERHLHIRRRPVIHHAGRRVEERGLRRPGGLLLRCQLSSPQQSCILPARSLASFTSTARRDLSHDDKLPPRPQSGHPERRQWCRGGHGVRHADVRLSRRASDNRR